MTDESKVKTTFIRPVNRTMSYEDRRGYVCMYDIIILFEHKHCHAKLLNDPRLHIW